MHFLRLYNADMCVVEAPFVVHKAECVYFDHVNICNYL